MIVNNVEYEKFNQFIVYENANECVEIDGRGVRKISKFDNQIINNPEVVSTYEDGNRVTIVVDGQEFAQVEHFKKTVYE